MKHNIIDTKWIFCNKQDEDGIVVKNKARLVAQGYTQIEGIDFGETYAPVARLDSIRVMLSFANHNNILLYQMDVKSAFLNGEIEEEVYVMQPLSFEDKDNPEMVYRLHKALYGLNQAPRAWYETLKDFLLKKGFKPGTTDPLYSLDPITMNYLCLKYMWMILSLVVLTLRSAKNFLR